MNKKILAVLAVMALGAPAIAQGPLGFPRSFYETLRQGKYDYSFEKNMIVLSESFLLTIPVTKQYFPEFDEGASIPFHETSRYRDLARFEEVKTYPVTTGCKAYALDKHWIMAGGTCVWNGRHTTDFTPSSSSYIFATGLVDPNPAEENLKISGNKIPWKENLFIQPREHQVPHVILVRVPENSNLAKRLERWPKINVLAFGPHTNPTKLTGGNFYINSARFGFNKTHKRSLDRKNTKEGASFVKLEDSLRKISGVSTDPLAYIKDNQLHWIGVNQGITELRYGNLAGEWDGYKSEEYFFFTEKDADFIKQTISQHDPAAWKRIEARKGLEIFK